MILQAITKHMFQNLIYRVLGTNLENGKKMAPTETIVIRNGKYAET